MASWAPPGGLLGASWRHLGRLGSVLGASWGRLGASWAILRHLGASWSVLGRLGLKKTPKTSQHKPGLAMEREARFDSYAVALCEYLLYFSALANCKNIGGLNDSGALDRRGL